jgi:uncharacterized protein (TIGR02996 family)
MNDEVMLLRSIIDNPNEDTPRLMFADWLEEHSSNAICYTCEGYKYEATYGPARRTCIGCDSPLIERTDTGNQRGGHNPTWCPKCWASHLPEHDGYKVCTTCSGTGYIRGERARRAEFIRHQINSPASPCRSVPLTMLTELEPFVGPAPHNFVRNWSGVGVATVTYPKMEFWYRRGFVDEVLLSEDDYMGFAHALCKQFPLRRVTLTNLGPLRFTPYSGSGSQDWDDVWSWGRKDRITYYQETHWVKPPLWELLPGQTHREIYKRYATKQDTLDALSKACLLYGKGLVNG